MRCPFINGGVRRSVGLAVVSMFIASFTGCATGPLRYKTFGRYKYATVEFTERTPSLGKPFAAAGGVLADGTIAVADTLMIPLVSVPIALKTATLGPCPESRDFREHPIKEATISVLMFPIYLPWSYCLNLYLQSYEPAGTPYFEYFYPGLYGDESAAFTDSPIQREAPAFSPSE